MQTLAIKASAIFLTFCAASPFAQARPDTTTMSCNAAASLVNTRGAVVLGSGPSIYDRYVEDRGFCQIDEDTEPAFVPTADNRQCFVGYHCYQPTLNNDK